MNSSPSKYAALNRNLVGLCVFDVVASTGSFSAAAREMGMTQSAVSQRIKLLEESLDLTLFNRHRNGIELTKDGEGLLATVRPAMNSMANSLLALDSRKHKLKVCISLDYAFASLWLLPRLPDLRNALQQIDIQLLCTQTPHDSAGQNPDLIVSMNEKPNDESLRVFDEEVCAICSPDFSQNLPFASANELLHQPLLSLSGPANPPWHTWESWFQLLGVEGALSCDFTSFSNYDLVIRAAIAGQGVALGWTGLVLPLIEKRELVLATNDLVKSTRCYSISCNRGPNFDNGPQQVLNWFSEQVGE